MKASKGTLRKLIQRASELKKPIPTKKEGASTESKLEYVHNPSDDEMVRISKELFNRCGISLNDVYEATGDDGQGYNIAYALRKRNMMTWTKFKKILRFFGLKPVIKFKRIKKGPCSKKFDPSEFIEETTSRYYQIRNLD